VERLGGAYLLVGNFARALPALEEARGLWDRRHDDLARTGATVKLTTTYAAAGRYREVGDLLEDALVHRGRAHDSQWPVAEVHLTGGLLALDQGDEALARRELDRAMALSPAKIRGDLARRTLAEAGVARLAQLGGNEREAFVAADQAVTLAESPQVSQLPEIGAAALEAKGTTLCRFGRAPEGEPLLARVAVLRTQSLDPTSPLLARTQLVRAQCLLELGRTAEARALTRSAAGILKVEAGAWPAERALLRTVQSALH
jgi:tetratricopeptide (TPR) repeat protein